jgi:hypothetical protein
VLNDLFVMLDKSGSMNCPAADDACELPPLPTSHPTRWEAVTTGLSTFVSAPASAGTSVGLAFFPLNAASTTLCDAAAYAMPTVTIGPLPAIANVITNAIALNMPGGNTPTVPVLQGALTYTKTYISNTPARNAVVVLVTDGIPNGCNSTLDGATMVAAAGFANAPSLRTYVVGLGATNNLDPIALAGSGGETHYFPAAGNDVATAIAGALQSIAHETCAFATPMGIDPALVNVDVVVDTMETRVGRVGNSAACGALGGWYYDNALKPTRVVLCPASCEPFKSSPNAGVKLLLGCPSLPP